jgi:D-alanyl-lipoteichoic acid acyltransferase DltB (MBOAT superfamily)
MSAFEFEPARAGAEDRAVAGGRIGAMPLLIVLAQLGAVTLVLRQFQIESAAFLRLALLAFTGFAVHALLPLRWRMPFFLALSLAGIGIALGVANGLWLLALGCTLIGICHLPVAFSWRVALLLVAGLALALLRTDRFEAPWSGAIWPILASMFMFRMIVYLYDLRHDNTPAAPVRTLTYFFMLPNACFPLFPVIDYKTFRRNYFDADASRIYQTGIDWIVRGMLQLLLYRFVYYYLTLAPSEVRGPGDFAQFVVSNFLLYLRVSGLFHLVVGMLYQFGFRLPDTHHQYLLASSFTDFWRRINIYWKDFMLKVFYYPAYFRLRRYGPFAALVLSTLFVFAMTWLLHAYQWFWLRGTALLVWQDVLFWTILGCVVVVNAVYEDRHGRARTLAKRSRSLRSLLGLTLRTLATFTAICVLWSFWTTESISEWLTLWSALNGPLTLEARHAVVPVAILVVVAGTLYASGAATAPRSRAAGDAAGPRFVAPSAATIGALGLLVAAGLEPIYSHFGPDVASSLQAMRSGRLNRLDNAKLERGYYENLLRVDRFNSQLWEVYTKRPANWLDNEGSGALKEFTGDFAQERLKPASAITTNYGTMSTNRWGMRDQEYERTPAPGVFRMALLGPSSVMGWGVADGATFEALVEARLNQGVPGLTERRYEILNFGVAGYQPPQELVATEKALEFEPRALLYVATGRELSRASRYMVEVVNKRVAIPYPSLQDAVAQAGLTPGMNEAEALRRLAPHRAEILSLVYRGIAEMARRRGAVPVWIFLPQVTAGPWQEETPEQMRIAKEAGFVIIDLGDVYRGSDVAAIRLAEWDDHPNVRGHQLIADRLLEELQRNAAAIFAAVPERTAEDSQLSRRATR